MENIRNDIIIMINTMMDEKVFLWHKRGACEGFLNYMERGIRYLIKREMGLDVFERRDRDIVNEKMKIDEDFYLRIVGMEREISRVSSYLINRNNRFMTFDIPRSVEEVDAAGSEKVSLILSALDNTIAYIEAKEIRDGVGIGNLSRSFNGSFHHLSRYMHSTSILMEEKDKLLTLIVNTSIDRGLRGT